MSVRTGSPTDNPNTFAPINYNVSAIDWVTNTVLTQGSVRTIKYVVDSVKLYELSVAVAVI